jgi:hypothetical protein
MEQETVHWMEKPFCSRCQGVLRYLPNVLLRHDLLTDDIQQKWPTDSGSSVSCPEPWGFCLILGLSTQLWAENLLCSFCIFLRDAFASASADNNAHVPPSSEIVVLRAENSLRISARRRPGEQSWTTWTKKLKIEFFDPAWFTELPRAGSLVYSIHLARNGGFRNPRMSLVVLRLSTLAQSPDAGFLNYIQNGTFPELCYGSARQIPRSCNPALFARWLSECESGHGARCERGELNNTEGLRLLDVDTMRLMRFPKGSMVRYVALSYVWGTQEFECLRKENLDEALRTGFIADSYFHPAVQDAIQVVRGMRERYLWVDSLCIVQDCAADKSAQIELMASVYGNALLTLVAAGNDSSNLGLPGVNTHGLRNENRVFVQGKVCLVEARESDHFGHWETDNLWSTRAWTFQEYLLSSRRLIFSHDQVRWLCQCAEWHEGCYLESSEYMWVDEKLTWRQPLTTVSLSQLRSAQFGIYQLAFRTMISCYSARQLRYAEDRLSALKGVLKLLASGQWPKQYYWALTAQDFENEICWGHRIFEGGEYTLLTDCFPSWSWLSYPNPISILGSSESRSPRYESLVKCFRFDQRQGMIISCRPISSKVVIIADSTAWYPVFVRPEHFTNYHQLHHTVTDQYIAFWGNVAQLKINWNAGNGRAEIVVPGEEHGMRGLITNGDESELPSETKRLIAEDNEFIGQNNVDEWSSTPDKARETYDFVAIGATTRLEHKSYLSNPQYELLLLEWKGCIAYRAGHASVRKNDWDLVQVTRQLIVMG